MSDNGAIREYSTSGVSTFLHHTEVGEAIKQITFERDTYLVAGGCGRDYVMAYNNYERKGHYYINYYFENVKYDDKSFIAHFRAPDYDVECDFIFDRDTGDILISNNNKPVEEILPIPVHWLQMRLEENGTLRDFENKISI